MKTFSQPLSAKEEAVWLGRLKTGSERERGEAKKILVERNLRLVAHIAGKYRNVDEDMEDLISIGTIGLIKAIDSFDAGKGKLSTYASRCIDNELLMLLRAKKKTSREVSLYEPIGTDREGNEINLLDVIEQEQTDVVDRMEVEDRLRRLKGLIGERLTDREREIITLRYGLYGGREITQREIGRKLGISRSYVSRIEKRALQKLKEGYDNAFYQERRLKDRHETGASYLQ
ncbi:MAG: RNA polymerase sporulation sigma factor SigK [Bacteroidales bacterium]|nr:RNA polymerase sporulation sigma factor SigK [Bacteroidales bacterium]MCM1423814.1 RNA polymerase sporulation sigma factor SigK [bacterium]